MKQRWVIHRITEAEIAELAKLRALLIHDAQNTPGVDLGRAIDYEPYVGEVIDAVRERTARHNRLAEADHNG